MHRMQSFWLRQGCFTGLTARFHGLTHPWLEPAVMLAVIFSRAKVQTELLSGSFTYVVRKGREPIAEDIEARIGHSHKFYRSHAPYVHWRGSSFGRALPLERQRRFKPLIPKRAAESNESKTTGQQAPALGHAVLLLTGFFCWAMSGTANEAGSQSLGRFETLLLARTCLGLAAGLFTISVPAMIAEGLPKKKAEARTRYDKVAGLEQAKAK
eukprot:Skav226670  [mRNA]  locus=scaffold861:236653:238947:+ [translate_table: standard]